MNKKIKLSLPNMVCLLLVLVLLASCNTAPSTSQAEQSSTASADAVDTTRPRIRITNRTVTIYKDEAYDLLDGVTGSDDTDGDITDKIIIEKGDFNTAVPGEYVITYKLTDNAGNEAYSSTRTIIVKDNTVLEEYPIWTGEIEGEILNPQDPALFGGAWYHKVVSSKDAWQGIEAVITLPEVAIRRYDGEYDETLNADPNVKNLDNPSVYLGGNARSESDVGLSYSKALIDTKNQTLSIGCIAFRPFWRYITSTDQDLGGYSAHNGEYAVSANGNNCIANYHWKYTEYYYLPGDKLRILIHIPEPDKMQLQIEVLEKSTLPYSVELRELYGWKDPANFISPVFTSPGHGAGANAEFKRVNAIDQVANEGGTAITSNTEVLNAVWHSTYLYRTIDGTVYRVPMNAQRRGIRNAPDPTRFTVVSGSEASDMGGETVSIHPGYAVN